MFELLNPKNWLSKKEAPNGGGSAIFASRLKFNNPNKTEKLNAVKANDWVFGGVDLRAEVFADIEIKLFRRNKNGEKIEIKKHKALDMMKKPNKFITTFELLEVTSMHLDLVGESFWLVDLDAKEIWWLEPQRVSIVPDPVKFIKHYEYQLNNGVQTYSTDEIIHFKKPDPASHYSTTSALDACARTYNLDQHATEWNWKFFKQGAAASVLLYFKQKFGKGIFKQFIRRFRDEHEGTENAHKTAFLEHEVGKVDLDRTQKDMQFVELQEKTRDKLLSAGFRVSKSLIGLDENSNRSTIDGTQYGFRAFVNRPRLKRFFSKLNSDFLGLFGDYFGQEIFFEFIDATPRDETFQLKLRDSDLKNGVISINEAREQRGLEPVVGGEIPTIPANYVPIDSLTVTEPVAAKKVKVEKRKFKKPNKKLVLGAYLKRFKGNELKLQSRMRLYFSDLEKDILARLKKNADKLQKNFQTKDLESDILGDKKVEELKLFNKMFPLMLAVGGDEGQAAIAELGMTDTFAVAKIRQRLSTQTQRFAKQVTTTTFGLLKNELSVGIEAGESEIDLSKRVKKVFKNAKTYRAKTIARTETNTASNLAHKTAYDQLGVPLREWVSAHDFRTRDAHESADGQVVEKDKSFEVGGESLDYPSDPSGSAANTINCRCRTIPHFDD